MSVKPLWTTPPQFVDANGDPYSGAFLYFYVAGSSTKQDTFTSSSGGVACPNPITLNSSGYPAISGTVTLPWGTVGQTYKIGLAAPGSSDPPSSFIWSADNISPINDTTVTIDQWVSGPAPTYVSATQFTLVGDQTSTFQVGRRVKTTNSGGTVYSYISVSAYTALTTVTVVNDSGTLDAGLSAVSYGLLSSVNPSVPQTLRGTKFSGIIDISTAGVTLPSTQVGQLYYGTYTPTLTAVANIDATTAFVCRYFRIGNQVMVSGRFNLDTTAGAPTATQLGISLPIASNFGSANTDCSGTAASDSTVTESFSILADVANDWASFSGYSYLTNNRAVYFQFTYTII